MKYLVIGAGGTGGCIAGYMSKAGKDVTVIARNKTLNAIKTEGLTINSTAYGTFTTHPKVYDEQSYNDAPDVIFLCVKSYSVDELVPFIKRISTKNTVLIPILNIYTTGEKLRKMIPSITVTDGCIYIASNELSPGNITTHGDIFRIVFGVQNKEDSKSVFHDIQQDIIDSNIDGILSDNIRCDALRKFSYVSAQASCGLYYGVTAGDIQKNPEIRNCFSELVHEIDLLAKAMGIDFGEDIVKRNLAILDNLLPTSSTSMQRDIEKGGKSEIDGLLFSVVETAEKYGLNLNEYSKISNKFKNLK